MAHLATEKIRIVMVEPTHPGNIGAAARAMKTMGYRHLYLVKPKIYPHADATARAAGADDILAEATVCDSLVRALRGCATVAAMTARIRTMPHAVFTPRHYASQLPSVLERGHAAVVFGRESSGLSNAELEHCNVLLTIPANPEFNSLNVASAIQIVCYEFAQVLSLGIPEETGAERDPKKIRLATHDEMDYFYAHLEESMVDVGFLNPDQTRRLMRRLKSLFNRAQLDENELSILRGFLAAVQKSVASQKKRDPV